MLDPIYNAFGAVLAFFYAVIPNEGVAIILVTVTVMLALFPLTAKSSRSMLAMQRLQPEIKKLQAKHKGDRQKLNEEMMKLYQEHKVNPLGGCLPLVVQMPIFIALFHVLRSPLSSVPVGSALYTDLKAAHGALTFLGMDLSLKATDPHGSLWAAVPYYILVGLVFLTGYLQSKQQQRNAPSGAANTQMQMVTKVLPIAFGAFSLFFPAGLVLYFLVSNSWRLGQQELIIKKIATPDHLRKDKDKAIDVKGSTTKPERARPDAVEPRDGKEPAEEPRRAPPPKPVKGSRPAKPAPTGARQSPFGALRDLFRPPADASADGPKNNSSATKPQAAPSKQPAGQRGGSSRAGQTRRRRRRSSNKKRKR
jgi:YidC/Oxa1 family membrane protein insertase